MTRGSFAAQVLKLLDLTFPIPEANLACDEALLELGEGGYEQDILRLWQPAGYFVVLGYTNKIHAEVNVKACATHGVPILRRSSGGGTVLQGPGCLNYSLVLQMKSIPELGGISETNTFIMERQHQAISAALGTAVEIQGITDLAIDGRKFSGNAQRRKRHCLLFHGTLLLDFDISLVGELLHMPEKQPGYRQQRRHSEFLTNLHLNADAVKTSLKKTWGAAELLDVVPIQRIEQLATKKYATTAWTQKF